MAKMLSRSSFPARPVIEPGLPTLARIAPDGPLWVHEIKHDGFRFIARRDGDRVRVFSRHEKDWSDKVPAIVEAMLALPVKSATIDGEGVVVGERGVTDFERLRSALGGRGDSRAVFLYGFDLLHLDNEDLRRHPWEIRRAALTGLLRKASRGVRLPSTSTATAKPSSDMPVRPAPKASSRSGAIAPTAAAVAPIG